LLVGYLGALGLGAYELRRAPALSLPPAAPEQTAPSLSPLEVPPDVISSIAAYDAIVERPLFSPDRRPELPEVVTVQTDNSEPEEGLVEIDGFRLTAVLRDADRTTVLIEDRTGKTLSLHAGERLGNWQLDEILDDRVVLIADGRSETLLVYDFSEPAAGAPARRGYRRITQQPRRVPAPVRRQPPQSPNRQ
jgi:hypothetical protein